MQCNYKSPILLHQRARDATVAFQYCSSKKIFNINTSMLH